MSSIFRSGAPTASNMRLAKCTAHMVGTPRTKSKYISHSHTRTGPVVRITPDEVHVEESTGTRTVDRWIKGTRKLVSRGHASHKFEIKRRSISRVRSMLRVEINHIISGLVEKHQVHRVVSTKVRPLKRDRVWTVGDSDLEDAQNMASTFLRCREPLRSGPEIQTRVGVDH